MLAATSTGLEGLAAMTCCEMPETIEKHPDGDKAGVMISTGGASLLNDFAAVVAFCTQYHLYTRHRSHAPIAGDEAACRRASQVRSRGAPNVAKANLQQCRTQAAVAPDGAQNYLIVLNIGQFTGSRKIV
jgi:hypothetical protein